MPKKHAPAYAHVKPSYVHPSLQSTRASSSTAPQEPQTVSQRLHQLRREQAPRPTPEQRDELTSAVSSRTVPPSLRRILHIPEVNAPNPKPGQRSRRVHGGPRPPPGPAAPSSWLLSSRHAPHALKAAHGQPTGASSTTPRFGILARTTDSDFKRLPASRSLAHACLRTFALHWQALAEYEQHYIPTLPIALREALLSYLTAYGQRGDLDFTSFKILFQPDDITGISGWDDIRLVDLTGLLNEHFTINDLSKCLKRSKRPASQTLGLDELSVHDAKIEHERRAVADSWEDEVEGVTSAPLPAILPTPHFSHLSRLSLAHPGAWASWPDLLKFAPSLNKITHLSLAYWPRPSTTPNAATTDMVAKHTSVALGGSHFYSDLDDDWHEAANILRRLSVHTYSLTWLDLEGCAWLPALTWRSDALQSVSRSSDDPDEWQYHTASPGPDWNDSWRRVAYIHVFQGWIPSSTQALQDIPANIVGVQLMRWLREHKRDGSVQWKLNESESGRAVSDWLNREKVARSVKGDIHVTRKKEGGEWCEVDHGWTGAWEPRAVV